EYQRRLVKHKLYDLEGRFWYARDLLGRGVRRPFEAVRAVFVDGFTDFTRTQHEILEALVAWVEELWITLPDEPGDVRAGLFSRPRMRRAKLQHLQPVLHWLPTPSAVSPIPLAPKERPKGKARRNGTASPHARESDTTPLFPEPDPLAAEGRPAEGAA